MSSVLLPSSACFTVHNSHALNTKDNNQKDNPGSLGSQLGRAPLARCLLLPLPSPGVRRPYFSVFPLSGSRRLAAAHTPSGRHPSFFLFHAHSPPSALICLRGPAGRRPPATACRPGTTVRFGSPSFPSAYRAPLSSLVLYRRSRSKYGAFSQCWSTDCFRR